MPPAERTIDRMRQVGLIDAHRKWCWVIVEDGLKRGCDIRECLESVLAYLAEHHLALHEVMGN